MSSRLPVTEADVVVIGTGAFGLSAAYHLASLGAGRVVALDQFAPASQSSPRAAGLFKLIQADQTLTRVARLSIEIVSTFAAATGVALPVVLSGSIRLARTPAHAEMIRAEAAAVRGFGIELELIDRAALRRRAPYLTGANLTAACWIPGDIYIEEPATMLTAYQTAAERHGARIIGHTAVTGIRLQHGRVTGVMTPRGEIQTERVVNAAGAWAPLVGDLARTTVPVATVRHQLQISHPMAGIAAADPITRVTDAGAYVRPARGGLLSGRFEANPLLVNLRAEPAGYTMDQVPLDPAVLAAGDARISDQIPALRDQRIAERRGGLFTMSADGRFLVGPAPGIAGFWLATGCNGSGFSMAPGIGRALAEW
ncbi:MAG: FAD-binding oxidoreductase, partial [Chloroflexota bacterium]|nr:FAD-binding oxidoreductase [Chloroflexota bacterium]